MKAILVLNKTPKGCLIGCPCCVKEDDNEYHCVGKDNRNIQHFYDDGYCGRPNWCPLLEINDNIAKLIEVAR